MDLSGDFEVIIELCETLEGTTIPVRLKRRIAKAYDRAVGKAIVLGWAARTDPKDIIDDGAIRNTLLRHAERGARDFLA
jgi:hypothetical protein